jgi:fatty acid desaturase
MREELKALHRPNLWRWLLLAGRNWAEIILAFLVAGQFPHPVVYVLVWIFLGTRLQGLALLGHEAIHRNICRNKTLNDLLGNLLCALPLNQTLNWFHKFHTDHHTHLMGDHDPEVAYRAHRPRRWSLPMTPRKRLELLVLDLSGLGVWESLNVLRHTLPQLRLLDFILPLSFWAAAWSAAWALDLLWVPTLWWVVLASSYWAMFRQRALIEHLGSEDTHRIHPTALEKFFFLPHNCWIHYEHHLWPGIPCWNLEKARALDQSRPVVSTREYFKNLASSP